MRALYSKGKLSMFFSSSKPSFRLDYLRDVYGGATTRWAISWLYFPFFNPFVPTFQTNPFWQDSSPTLISSLVSTFETLKFFPELPLPTTLGDGHATTPKSWFINLYLRCLIDLFRQQTLLQRFSEQKIAFCHNSGICHRNSE